MMDSKYSATLDTKSYENSLKRMVEAAKNSSASIDAALAKVEARDARATRGGGMRGAAGSISTGTLFGSGAMDTGGRSGRLLVSEYTRAVERARAETDKATGSVLGMTIKTVGFGLVARQAWRGVKESILAYSRENARAAADLDKVSSGWERFKASIGEDLFKEGAADQLVNGLRKLTEFRRAPFDAVQDISASILTGQDQLGSAAANREVAEAAAYRERQRELRRAASEQVAEMEKNIRAQSLSGAEKERFEAGKMYEERLAGIARVKNASVESVRAARVAAYEEYQANLKLIEQAEARRRNEAEIQKVRLASEAARLGGNEDLAGQLERQADYRERLLEIEQRYTDEKQRQLLVEETLANAGRAEDAARREAAERAAGFAREAADATRASILAAQEGNANTAAAAKLAAMRLEQERQLARLRESGVSEERLAGLRMAQEAERQAMLVSLARGEVASERDRGRSVGPGAFAIAGQQVVGKATSDEQKNEAARKRIMAALDRLVRLMEGVEKNTGQGSVAVFGV